MIVNLLSVCVRTPLMTTLFPPHPDARLASRGHGGRRVVKRTNDDYENRFLPLQEGAMLGARVTGHESSVISRRSPAGLNCWIEGQMIDAAGRTTSREMTRPSGFCRARVLRWRSLEWSDDDSQRVETGCATLTDVGRGIGKS